MPKPAERLGLDYEPREPNDILEIGSGTNPLFLKWADYPELRKFMPPNSRFTLTDVDRRALESIPKILQTIGYRGDLKNIKLVPVNGIELPFPTDSFGRIFVSDVLSEHVVPNGLALDQAAVKDYLSSTIDPSAELQNMLALIAECRRVLKSEGELLIINRAVAKNMPAFRMMDSFIGQDTSWAREKSVAYAENPNNPALPPASVWKMKKI